MSLGQCIAITSSDCGKQYAKTTTLDNCRLFQTIVYDNPANAKLNVRNNDHARGRQCARCENACTRGIPVKIGWSTARDVLKVLSAFAFPFGYHARTPCGGIDFSLASDDRLVKIQAVVLFISISNWLPPGNSLRCCLLRSQLTNDFCYFAETICC